MTVFLRKNSRVYFIVTASPLSVLGTISPPYLYLVAADLLQIEKTDNHRIFFQVKNEHILNEDTRVKLVKLSKWILTFLREIMK